MSDDSKYLEIYESTLFRLSTRIGYRVLASPKKPNVGFLSNFRNFRKIFLSLSLSLQVENIKISLTAKLRAKLRFCFHLSYRVAIGMARAEGKWNANSNESVKSRLNN